MYFNIHNSCLSWSHPGKLHSYGLSTLLLTGVLENGTTISKGLSLGKEYKSPVCL